MYVMAEPQESVPVWKKNRGGTEPLPRLSLFTSVSYGPPDHMLRSMSPERDGLSPL